MLVIDTSKPIGSPEDYGRKDWHHNEFGQVDYPIYIDSKHPVEITGILDKVDIEKQRWHESCSDQALENMQYGRDKRSAMVEAWDDWERWLNEWN